MNRPSSALILTYVIANALLLYLGYLWLGMSESDGVHLAGSIAVLLFVVFCSLWVHGTALASFDRSAGLGFPAAVRRTLGNLLPLFAIAVAAAIIYGLLAWWHDSFAHSAFLIGSYGTMKLRKPVSPSAVERGFHVLIWILRWVIVPVVLLPLAAAAAIDGWSGFRWRSLRPSRRVLYWIETCALLVCAVWVPLLLVNWMPPFQSFAAQFASLAVRLIVGYLIFIAALLSLEFFTASGRPRATQVSTASAP